MCIHINFIGEVARNIFIMIYIYFPHNIFLIFSFSKFQIGSQILECILKLMAMNIKPTCVKIYWKQTKLT